VPRWLTHRQTHTDSFWPVTLLPLLATCAKNGRECHNNNSQRLQSSENNRMFSRQWNTGRDVSVWLQLLVSKLTYLIVHVILGTNKVRQILPIF